MRIRPHLIAAAGALAVPAIVPAQQPPPYEMPPAPTAEPSEPARPPLKPLKPVPALRRAVLIERVAGRVTFQLPTEAGRRRLTSKPTAVPMQTIIHATGGRVRLTVERDTRGRRSRGVFYGGSFMVSQGKGDRPLTHLRLTGEFDMSCDETRASAAAKKPRKRRLWGDGKGRFRTRGFYSAATVRGTKWLVEDRCDGTLTRVVRGEVEVVDYAVTFSDQTPPPAPPSAPESGGGSDGGGPIGGPPAPAVSPTSGKPKPRKVRVRRGGSYVASPAG